jgi:hypothetical protein
VKGHYSSNSVMPACYKGLCPARNVGVYFLAETFRMALCTVPCIYYVPVTLLVGVKQMKYEAVHSALPSVEVKNFGALFQTACLPYSTLGGIDFLCLLLLPWLCLSLPCSRPDEMNCLTFLGPCIVLYSYSKISSNSSPLEAGSSSCLTYACCCMCSFELLMMDRKTVQNM